MMLHPVLEQLKTLKLDGMLEALQGQNKLPDIGKLGFEERLGLLVEHEVSLRESKRVKRRLNSARLKTPACFEDISFKATRKLDKSLVVSLETCQWLRDHRNIFITGSTGTGKTFLAEAFAHKACLKGFTALSVRLPRFLEELVQAKAEGAYLKRLLAISKIDILLLDDFGISPFTDQNRRDFLEILDDRYKKKSTIITSQLARSQTLALCNWRCHIGRCHHGSCDTQLLSFCTRRANIAQTRIDLKINQDSALPWVRAIKL
jgi:DNA replication protein DnaC